MPNNVFLLITGGKELHMEKVVKELMADPIHDKEILVERVEE